MKRTLILNAEELDQASYTLQETDTAVKLFFSKKFGDWSKHQEGKLAGKIESYDDGLILRIGTQELELDYGSFEVLVLLLREFFIINPNAALPPVKEWHG